MYLVSITLWSLALLCSVVPSKIVWPSLIGRCTSQGPLFLAQPQPPNLVKSRHHRKRKTPTPSSLHDTIQHHLSASFFSCESISKPFLSSIHRLITDSLLFVLLIYHNIASSQLVTSNRQRENMSRRSGTTSNDANSPVKGISFFVHRNFHSLCSQCLQLTVLSQDAETKAKATELAVDNRHFSMIR